VSIIKIPLRDNRTTIVQAGLFLLLIFTLFAIVVANASRLGYNWQWYRVYQYLWQPAGAGLLVQGLYVTLKVVAVSLPVSFLFGLFSALGRLAKSPVARLLSFAYLELIRNTPLLIQLFFIYFVLAPVLDMSRFSSAVLALSLFEGAYICEILRAGIQSIPAGQWQAARSLGMPTATIYRHIVLPQAVRHMLPPLTSQAVSLVKDSALVSTIAVYDLTMQGQAIIAETFLTFEIWFTIALIYLILTSTLSMLAYYLANRCQNT